MALQDVTHTVSDGLLGFEKAKGDGLHVKIGVSTVESATPITITGTMNAAGIKSRLGLSPLADAAMDAVQCGSDRLYCVPVKASTGGTIGSIIHQGDGDGTIAAVGSPNNAFSVIVEITAQGGRNTAAFTVSVDGGYSKSDEMTVPISGEYEIPDTGITITFTDGTPAATSFMVGATYAFATTAPTMTNGDILAAIAGLSNFAQEYEFIHVVGESTLPTWLAVAAAQLDLQDTYKKPGFIKLEAAYPGDDVTDLTDWALQMEADRKKVKNYNIQVVAAWGRLIRLDGTTQVVNLAGVTSGLYAKAKVQESVGKVREEAGYALPKSQLLELLPAAMNSTIIEMMDKAGFLTFREYDGLDNFYVYHTKMMCPDGSDYRYAEDVRVLNKIIRETRKEALLILQDDIDMEDVQGELETRAKFIATALDKMVKDKEISSYQIIVLEGQAATFLQDGIMKIKVRYLSRGVIREIVIDLGRSSASN